MDNNGPDPLEVPGFGDIPLHYTLDTDKTFDDGANGWTGWNQSPRLTARELAIVQLISRVTDIHKWYECVNNEQIVAQWREKALETPLISEKAWEWCVAELRDKAILFGSTKRVLNLDTGTSISKSDEVPSGIRESFITEIASVYEGSLSQEQEDAASKNGHVLLVNPSMFPLVYGKTKVLMKECIVDLDQCLESYRDASTKAPTQSERVPTPAMLERESYSGLPFSNRDEADLFRWSTRFQWLPCEVSFVHESRSDTAVKIASYINNINPGRNRPLYRTIESLISLAIEPWNDCLILGSNARVPMRIRTYGVGPASGCACPEGLMCKVHMHPDPGTVFSFADWKEGRTGKTVVKKTNHSDPHLAEETQLDSDHKFYKISLQDTFRDQGLQVIVKISSIQLDSSQPNYSGSEWTLEGQLNEHIVATAAYYYNVENITTSSLSFRQETDMSPNEYVFDSQTEGLRLVFGVPEDVRGSDSDDPILVPPTQEIGSVTTPQGRLLAWPNALQHRIEPFELVDKSRSGYRNCVVLYLVDPHYRICSTRTVPPQQHHWWAEAALTPNNFPPGSAATRFPQEVKNAIMRETGFWPMGIDEASEICAEVEKDRALAFEAIMARMDWYDFYDVSY